MKQIAVFNQIFVKLSLLIFGVSLLSPLTTYAANFSVSSALVTSTTATVTVKSSNPSLVKNADIVLARVSDGDVNWGETGSTNMQTLAANGTLKEKFSGLLPGTKYTVRVLYNATAGFNSIQVENIGTVTTAGTTPVTTTPPAPTLPVLPVEFVKTSTVTSDSQINLTIKNTSSDTFEIEILAAWAAGNSVVDTRKTTLTSGASTQVSFYDGIRKGETYNFTMIGKKVGSTTKYQQVKYEGVKASGAAIATPPVPTGNNPIITTPDQTTQGDRDPLTGTVTVGNKTCGDGKDNDGDGKYDWDGVAVGGIPQYPPDPACINKDMTESADDVAKGSWIPCTNKCDLPSVFALLNSLITKLITVILFPIVIIMFVYAGYKYITAQGNPSKKANIKRMLGHIILGMVIILTAWLVVKTVLLVIGYDQTLYFFEG